MKKLSINAMSDYLSKLIDHNIQSSLMLWGAPGIGKSAIVANVAKKNKIDLIDLRISQLAPTDLRGLPVPENNKAKWYIPEFLPTKGKGILFLDEINRATIEVQQCAFQLVLDRQINGIKLHPETRIYAAINEGSEYQVLDMDPALLRRFWTMALEPTVEDWLLWARENNDISKIMQVFIKNKSVAGLLNKIFLRIYDKTCYRR